MKMILSLCSLMAILGLCSRDKFGTIAKGNNEKPEGSIKSYEYSYSGTMAYPIEYYEIKRLEDGTVQLGWSKDDNDIHLIRVADTALARIGKIAEENRLYKIKRSYYPKMQVLDGYGWHFYMTFESGSISSGGSNAGPGQQHSNTISSINGYIQSLINSSSPADSLGIAYHYDYGDN